MQIKAVMTQIVECIRPEATLQEAAELMKECDVGLLPVSENDRLAGVLTDRDITVRSVSFGDDPWTERVRDAMTPEVFYCFEDQDIAVAAQIMRERQVRRLPVLDREKQLVGIVSLGDLVVTADEQLAGHALEGISELSPPKLTALPRQSKVTAPNTE